MPRRHLIVALLLLAAIAGGVLPPRPAKPPRPVKPPRFLASQRTGEHPTQTQLISSTPETLKAGTSTQPALVLIIGCATLVSAGSIVLLVLASLVHLPVPTRSLIAASAVACAAALLEALVGHPRRRTFVGATISEVGQALAIAASGWLAFSIFWANGYGSLLTPGRKPILNAGAVLGCTVAAALYARARPASRAQTALPFASAIVMLHLHLLVTDTDIERLKLAPMALASAVLALLALGLDALVQRALHATADSVNAGGGPQARPYFARVRGTEDMVIASLVVNLIWTTLTLLKWTWSEAPSWGFAAISAVLTVVELGMRATLATVPTPAKGARAYYVSSMAGYYHSLGTWLGLLCAWRALWPDAPYDTRASWWREMSEAEQAERARRAFRKREKHFFSLIGSYTLWGLASAFAGRKMASGVAVAMVMLVIFKTAVASLFGEPLLMAGVLGLALGAALIWLVVRFSSDEKVMQD